MQENFNIEQERFESALMAQAYAYAGQRLQDVLPPAERDWDRETGTCAGCQGTFPQRGLFTRGGVGALCLDCEDRRLAVKWGL